VPLLIQGKTNWRYILIVLILAVIVGGGILSYLRYLKREISSFSKFPEIKKPEKIETEKLKIEEETANWEIYQFSVESLYQEYSKGSLDKEWNEKLKKDIEEQMKSPPFKDCEFEIKFPKDWKVSRYPWPLHGYYPIPSGISISKSLNGINCQLDIDMLAAPENISQFINSLENEGYLKREVRVNRYPAIELTDPTGSRVSYFVKNNNTYCLPISWDIKGEGNEKCIEFYNQMLSTFRFLE
jgi:hypothetical protein